MPAITDPQGPDGKPISVFESGAILQYLARKTGQFYGSSAREQAEVEQWLFWQMGGLGPMAGQAHHFRSYARKVEPDESKLEYGANRYTNEVNRLYGVMDRRLADRDYLAGPYSIADMAAWPWILPEGQGQNLEDFPNLKAWVERLKERPALRRGRDAGKELRSNLAEDSEDAKKGPCHPVRPEGALDCISPGPGPSCLFPDHSAWLDSASRAGGLVGQRFKTRSAQDCSTVTPCAPPA